MFANSDLFFFSSITLVEVSHEVDLPRPRSSDTDTDLHYTKKSRQQLCISLDFYASIRVTQSYMYVMIMKIDDTKKKKT